MPAGEMVRLDITWNISTFLMKVSDIWCMESIVPKTYVFSWRVYRDNMPDQIKSTCILNFFELYSHYFSTMFGKRELEKEKQILLLLDLDIYFFWVMHIHFRIFRLTVIYS